MKKLSTEDKIRIITNWTTMFEIHDDAGGVTIMTKFNNRFMPFIKQYDSRKSGIRIRYNRISDAVFITCQSIESHSK